jgi:very-short-patch-repair endonuclease
MRGLLGYKIRAIACLGCGNTVTRHARPNQHYCSLACYRQSARPQRRTGELKKCDWCGKEVYIERSRIEKTRRFFCNRAHATAYQGRNKTGHVCKICGATFYWSPSRHVNHKITYCSLTCRDADPERRELLLRKIADQQRCSPNGVERAGYAILNNIGVAYLPQHPLARKFCVDAFVPGSQTVVQFDGDYWHGNFAKFPAPNSMQKRRIALDRSQDAYLRKCGITIIRVWESDIKRDPSAVTARLRALLVQPSTAGPSSPPALR